MLKVTIILNLILKEILLKFINLIHLGAVLVYDITDKSTF